MMKLSDLKAVCREKVLITINGYFDDGEYYSFRSYSSDGLPIPIEDVKEEHILDMEIISIRVSVNNTPKYLMVDVKEILTRSKET